MDLGLVPASKGFGFAFQLEPKYNISDNMNIGLRLASTAILKNSNTVVTPNTGQVAAIGSYTGTFDYYFTSGDNFAPFVGGGVGYNKVANILLSDVANQKDFSNSPISNVIGGLIRGGFELGKFRMSLEYNILPKSTAYTFTGTKLGKVANSFLGVNLGFYVGGGKWGK